MLTTSYFFVVAQVTQTKSLFSRKNSKGTLKTIFQKQVSEIEALAIFNELSGIKTNQAGGENNEPLLLASANTTISSTEAITLLLAGAIQKTEVKTPESKPQPVASPYFPTKDIFLSVQKTRAPAFI
jgi:hypothetical protein